ncbi:hypothetical protein K6L24_09675 [Erwinia persicina]|uniref:hypothetical protein n=1 Tax=Erwinia persicina TaxID=55211 RepID=UPI001C9A491B|nr:hypothetical protein [Erwinia persicina]QZQ52002.1 hypothetical protein K6L24_09675 [Erwinia persicina]
MKEQTKRLTYIVIKQQIFNILIFAACVFVSILIYKKIIFNDLKDILSTLLNLSAAIFTIVGLWVGFLYPNAINSIIKDDISYIKNQKDAPRIEKLVYVIIISALVMLGTLVIFLLRVVIPTFPLYFNNIKTFKIACLTLIFFMCWMQSKCVFSIILSNLHFVNSLHGKLNKAKLEHTDD